jgi:hydrogenase nickel incorporation protein HypB
MDIVRPPEGSTVDIELDEDFLRKNREVADENRRFLDSHSCKAVDVLGAIGAGKTSLVKFLVRQLRQKYGIAVVAGDLTTEVDATRIVEEGVKVIQINTGKECHLDANLLKKALERLDLGSADLLLIENVGNLICPVDFPLGSHLRIVVISVTEGPYTVVKHPYIIADADLLVINKIDLCDNMGFSWTALKKDGLKIKPSLRVAATNCITGEGIDEVIRLLGL